MKFKIYDWAGNICFFNKTFESFDDGQEFLQVVLEDYENDRQEYFVEPERDSK